MKEVIRCKKVNDGVIHAAKIYPNGYIIMIIIGTIKGDIITIKNFILIILNN